MVHLYGHKWHLKMFQANNFVQVKYFSSGHEVSVTLATGMPFTEREMEGIKNVMREYISCRSFTMRRFGFR